MKISTCETQSRLNLKYYYILDCTAFNLLTESAAFQRSNPAVVMSQHLLAPPPLDLVSGDLNEQNLTPSLHKQSADEKTRYTLSEMCGLRVLTGRPIFNHPGRRGRHHQNHRRTDTDHSEAYCSNLRKMRASRLGPAILIVVAIVA